LEEAGQQVRQLGGEYVGVEHLLLALIHQRTGVAARALAQLGAGYDAVHIQLVRLLADSPPTAPEDLPPPPR
jgi:ATP-dependent Clp protease ATP-binding subunit ClpC